jgi:D-glycero-D-manno-heptose 1,7-bisphosphate phosphatase
MKLVLLDRDGVINRDCLRSVKSKEEFCLLPRAAAAIKLLNEASVPIAVVTNQACVGRGDLSEEGLEEIHAYMKDLLKEEGAFVDHIFVCTSADPAHPCRKPNPGLLLEALKMFNVTYSDVVIIGDDLRDLEAGKAAECHRILVQTGKGSDIVAKGLPERLLPVGIFEDLFEAVTHLTQVSL